MKKLLKNCRLIDGKSDEIREISHLFIENGDILKIETEEPTNIEGYEVIDCKGKIVMPGLIDSHVHLVWDGSGDPQSVINHLESDAITLRAYKHAMDYLQLGITTVRD